MDRKRNMSDNFDCRGSKQRKITDYFKPKQRKITDYFKFRDSPHKIWHVAKKGQMQNLITRFPQLTEEIFGLLDYQTLVKCRKVNENWYNAVTNQRIYWIQMINKYTNGKEEYHQQWMKAIDKTPFEILKKLARLPRVHCKEVRRRRPFCPYRSMDMDGLYGSLMEVEPELSLFHILASEGDIDLFKYVAGKVECKNILGTKKDRWCKKKKYYPLHEAASRGNFDLCKFIIGQANDKNPANDIGHTPFHTAANYCPNDLKYVFHQHHSPEIVGHFEICKIIFESTGFQNPSDNYGMTPLHSAASHGNLQICQMIIEKVNVANPISNDGRHTPLHIAAESGYFEICKLIVEKVADKNPQNIDGETPLHRAADNDPFCEDHFKICQLIIDIIAEKNPRNHFGTTPLHYAAHNGNLELCKFIIGKIQERNPRNEGGITPLHYAAENNRLEICEVIIEEGLEENNPSDDDGNTPLHTAVRYGNLEICKLVCQNSDNKNPKDDEGKTPLDYAYEKGDPRILEFLIGENKFVPESPTSCNIE